MSRRELLRADGTAITFDAPLSMKQIRQMIGADTLDSFSTADRLHVVMLDDLGHQRGLPRNEAATALYLERCHPGTTHYIAGDVVIAPDADFGDAE